jgi:hypothetical protein
MAPTWARAFETRRLSGLPISRGAIILLRALVVGADTNTTLLFVTGCGVSVSADASVLANSTFFLERLCSFPVSKSRTCDDLGHVSQPCDMTLEVCTTVWQGSGVDVRSEIIIVTISDRSVTVSRLQRPCHIVVTLLWRVTVTSPPIFHSASVWSDSTSD